MAKLRTPFLDADKAAYWQARADEYDREAAKCITAGRHKQWTDKANAAREKAQQYLSPAPSGVQTAANPL